MRGKVSRLQKVSKVDSRKCRLLLADIYARRLLPDARMELPYEGAKEMLLVDIEDHHRVAEVVEAMWAELPKAK